MERKINFILTRTKAVHKNVNKSIEFWNVFKLVSWGCKINFFRLWKKKKALCELFSLSMTFDSKWKKNKLKVSTILESKQAKKNIFIISIKAVSFMNN